jgi:pseudo-rSAM protein
MRRLIIYPDVFIWRKGDDAMFYNSKTFNFLIVKIVSPAISLISEHLNNIDNLYQILLNRDMVYDNTVNDFVQAIVSGGYGCLVDETAQIVSLPPLLNIQSEISKIYGERRIEYLLEYLTDLTIYLGGEDVHYPDYYKQTFFPVKSDLRLSNDKIIAFLRSNRTPYLLNLNIVLSTIDDSTYELIDFLEAYGVKAIFYVSSNASDDIFSLKEYLASSNVGLCVVCWGGIENEMFYGHTGDCRFHFLVRSKNEYEKYESEILEYGIADYYIIPIYDNNLKFFEDNIFLSEEDIISSKLTKRHVFMNQAVNSNFFGSLTIMPDGNVYSNVNKPAIGTMDDKIQILIGNEMCHNNAWRYIRDMKPCSDCLYQWLCPSPSNYEMVIGKPNLCLINQANI